MATSTASLASTPNGTSIRIYCNICRRPWSRDHATDPDVCRASRRPKAPLAGALRGRHAALLPGWGLARAAGSRPELPAHRRHLGRCNQPRDAVVRTVADRNGRTLDEPAAPALAVPDAAGELSTPGPAGGHGQRRGLHRLCLSAL